MDRLLLNCFNLQRIELLVEYLAEIHHDRLVNLLPQVSAEDLDVRNLQCRNLSMHEDAGQIELHLEADVHIGSVDCG